MQRSLLIQVSLPYRSFKEKQFFTKYLKKVLILTAMRIGILSTLSLKEGFISLIITFSHSHFRLKIDASENNFLEYFCLINS